jgi:aspartate racemase
LVTGHQIHYVAALLQNRLINKFSINVLLPTDIEQDIIHRVIYQELCLEIVDNNLREQYLNIIQHLIQSVAQGIILGCTEIGLLIDKHGTATKLYDTTIIHALAAVEGSLK